jgi:hypothetical protein
VSAKQTYYVYSGQLRKEVVHNDPRQAIYHAIAEYCHKKETYSLDIKVHVSTESFQDKDAPFIWTYDALKFLGFEPNEIECPTNFVFKKSPIYESSKEILPEPIKFRSTVTHVMNAAKDEYGIGDVYLISAGKEVYFGSINEDGIATFDDARLKIVGTNSQKG